MSTTSAINRSSTSLDSVPFDNYGIRFSGTVATTGPETALDDKRLWICIGTGAGVSVKTAKKDGTVTRVDVLQITDALVADDELSTLLVKKLGLDLEDPQPVTTSNPRSATTNYARSPDPQTGEVSG